MLNNAENFKIDLAAEDKSGRTGLKLAKMFSSGDVVELIKRKVPNMQC